MFHIGLTFAYVKTFPIFSVNTAYMYTSILLFRGNEVLHDFDFRGNKDDIVEIKRLFLGERVETKR